MYDTKEVVNCPACGKKMKKVFIESTGFNLDICTDGCGGILFDNREFKRFDEQHENVDEILKELVDKTYPKQDESKPRVCPVCGATMVKHYTSITTEVEVDECYSCGAMFLDNGELEKVRAQYKTENDRKVDFETRFQNEHGQTLAQADEAARKAEKRVNRALAVGKAVNELSEKKAAFINFILEKFV